MGKSRAGWKRCGVLGVVTGASLALILCIQYSFAVNSHKPLHGQDQLPPSAAPVTVPPLHLTIPPRLLHFDFLRDTGKRIQNMEEPPTLSPFNVPTAEIFRPSRKKVKEQHRRVPSIQEGGGETSHLQNLRHAAVVVLCYNRAEYLTRVLRRLLSLHRIKDIGAVYISQDGDDDIETEAVAKSFATEANSKKEEEKDGFFHVTYLVHPRGEIPALQSSGDMTTSTQYLAAHYKWALDEVLVKRKHSHAIILEDDIIVSKDFLEFFDAFAPLLTLRKVPSNNNAKEAFDEEGIFRSVVQASSPTNTPPSTSTLRFLCISSWNENAFSPFHLPPDAVFLTSHFPGLGWMLAQEMWENDLRSRWPHDNWDHWMRASTTHKGRPCIAPLLSRNHNIGAAKGATAGTAGSEFFDKFLKPAKFYRGSEATYSDDQKLLSYDETLQEKISSFLLPPDESKRLGLVATAVEASDFNGVQQLGQLLQLVEKAQSEEAKTPKKHRKEFHLEQGKKVKETLSLLVKGQREKIRRPHYDEGKKLLPKQQSPALHILIPYLTEEFASLAANLSPHLHTTPRTHYKHCTWLQLKAFVHVNEDSGSDSSANDDTYLPFQYDNTTERYFVIVHFFLINRRLSPFIPPNYAVQSPPGLIAVAATTPGENCHEACASYSFMKKSQEGTKWKCAPLAFDFINDCRVLNAVMGRSSSSASNAVGGCPNGCTQGWGPDIPNIEVSSIGHPHMCLVTPELLPTCDASHPKTIRLCPCAPHGGSRAPQLTTAQVETEIVQEEASKESHIATEEPAGNVHQKENMVVEDTGKQSSSVANNNGQQPKLIIVASDKLGENCHETCSSQFHYDADSNVQHRFRCDEAQFENLNSCQAMKQHFNCRRCESNQGVDLPAFVAAEDDTNFGKCLLAAPKAPESQEQSQLVMSCFGGHRATRRLCPCIEVLSSQ